MIDTFKSLSKLLRYRRIHIDGTVFRLHSTLTVLILMCFCIIITTKQLVGEPIDCDHREGIESSILNQYCFIHSTFTVKTALGLKVGVDVPHPGVVNVKNDADNTYHIYYQWIWFILFFQAISFYLPRWIWKCLENGIMDRMVTGFDLFDDEHKVKEKIEAIVNYLANSRGQNDWYALQYFFCEVLAFVNCLGQMFFIDALLDHEFLNFGVRVIQFNLMDPDVRVDPMIRIFPRMTKCVFHRFGPSAQVEKVDSLCLLPINIYNEKIFIFEWFWFWFLIVLTAIVILFRLVLIACPFVRYHVCRLRFQFIYRRGTANHSRLNEVIDRLKIGDWFIIHMLGQNVETSVFKKILHELVDKYTNKADVKRLVNENLDEKTVEIPA